MIVPPFGLLEKLSSPPNASQTLKAKGMPKPVPNRLLVGAFIALGSGLNGMPQPVSNRRSVNSFSVDSSVISMMLSLLEASMAFNNKL